MSQFANMIPGKSRIWLKGLNLWEAELNAVEDEDAFSCLYILTESEEVDEALAKAHASCLADYPDRKVMGIEHMGTIDG